MAKKKRLNGHYSKRTKPTMLVAREPSPSDGNGHLRGIDGLLMPEAKMHKYYGTSSGQAFLVDSLKFLPLIRDNSVNLILTSPPFALKRKKEYGNEDQDKYCEWFLSFANHLRRILTEDGSFVLDLGGAYVPGFPVRSIYQFDLLVRLVKETGFYLAQEFYHYNPARLPAPAEWVNVRRVRVKDSVNVVWWLAKSRNPKADNRKILKPYSESMRTLLRNGYTAKLRPSGHDISANFSKDNGGAIPSNVLELSNTDSNSIYQQLCREHGVKVHPARFPPAFAEFFVKFLTNERDVIFDPFAGSNTTGFVAEMTNRRWLACELSEEYLKGSIFRFPDLAPDRKGQKRLPLLGNVCHTR